MIGAFASSIRAATTSAIEAGEVTDVIAGDNFAAFGANLTIHCSIARHFCDPLTSLRIPGPVTATIIAAGHLLVSNSARVFDFETHL